MTYPLLPLFLVSKNMSLSAIAIILSTGLLTSALAQPYLGKLSDQIGRKRMISVLSLMLGGAYVCFPFADDFASFVLLASLHNLCGYGVWLISDVLATELTELQSTGLQFGTYRTFSSSGYICGTFVGGLLAQFLGIDSIFFVSSVFYVVSLTLLSKVKEPEKRESRFAISSLGNAKGGLLDRKTILLFLICFCAFISGSAIEHYLAIYLREPPLNAPYTIIASTYSIMELPNLVLQPYLGRLSDRFGRKPIILLGLLCFFPRCYLTGILENYISVMLVQLINGLTFGGFYVASLAYLSDITPPEERGKAIGVFLMGMMLGNVVGAFLGGMLSASLGLAPMFQVLAFFSLAPAFLFAVSEWRTFRSPRSVAVSRV